ncbi:MAG: hypothetical protein RH860_01065 [Cytophagales bacterium]
MTSNFSVGDIIQGKLRGLDESFHPIIYFGEINIEFFDGGMITHSCGFGNVRLQNKHFSQRINSDSRPSYFVKNYLLKKQEWGPFQKIGELSNEGIKFVKSQLIGTTPQVWEDYN